MALEAVEALLREKIGLDAASLGPRAIARAVEHRRLACKMPNVKSYWQHLQRSSQELEALTEEVVVPETWFFRDREPFRLLSHHIQAEKSLSSTSANLRVLSLPCSTGEEPYSIAMTLLDTGLSPEHFQIDAVDISHKALAKAQRGIYSKRSFRGEETLTRQRYFRETEAGYELHERVRKTVNFIHGNLLNSWFLGQQQYAAIFCRNLLIYFAPEARSHALRNLNRLLQPNGLLFVGSAETGQMSDKQLVPIRHPFAFAYQKQQEPARAGVAIAVAARLSRQRHFPPQPSSISRQPSSTKTPVVQLPSQSAKSPKLATQNTQTASTPSSQIAPSSQSSSKSRTQPSPPISHTPHPTPCLDNAQALADCGQLDSAVAACKTYLAANPTSAPGYALLGTIYQGLREDKAAEQAFRRAIYLDPGHAEALFHLALLQERRGNLASATLLRQRLQRLSALEQSG